MQASSKTWLEVALNGAWTRKRQPGIPIAVQEIVGKGIACVQAEKDAEKQTNPTIKSMFDSSARRWRELAAKFERARARLR